MLGGPGELADFFDTYWRLIYGAAVKSGLNDAEAQDVVQGTVIIVARKMEDFKYDPAVDSFKGWLFTTRKQIAQQYRKRAREHGGGGRARNLDELTQELEEIPEQAGAGLEALWEQEWERLGRRYRQSEATGKRQAVSDVQFVCNQRVGSCGCG